MKTELQRTLTSRAEYLETHAHTLIIDADVHLTDMQRLSEAMRCKVASTDNYFHGRPLDLAQLLAEMTMARVDAALCWQNPSATEYGQDMEKNHEVLLRANQYVAECAARYPEKILPAGWTDPRALGVEGACALATQCVRELGFPIVKLNPAQNAYPMDSQDVIEVVQTILDLGAIPAFHYGADTAYTPASGLRTLATIAFPQPVIGVHMGGWRCGLQ